MIFIGRKIHVQVQFEGGELKALMELRDVDTVDAINDLEYICYEFSR